MPFKNAKGEWQCDAWDEETNAQTAARLNLEAGPCESCGKIPPKDELLGWPILTDFEGQRVCCDCFMVLRDK